MESTALVCLPFAGAGASFFRKWRPLAPESLQLVPVQLKGREERIAEEPHTDAGEAMDEACPWVVSQIKGADRVALFGHSLGAELAFELARRLRDRGVRVSRLFVSGAPGPRDRDVDRVSELDDAAFLEGLRRVAGYRHPAMDHPEMLEIMMPFLRADSVMHENYRSAYADLLDISVTSMRGRGDDLVSAAESCSWAGETTGKFSSIELDGSHMYLTDSAEPVLRAIADELEGSE